MKIGLAVLAALASATPLYAAADENPFARDTAVLRLDGLDLATPDGQRRLAIRMDAAARAVCGDRLSAVHLDMDAKARACHASVLADVRSQVETRTAARDLTGVSLASAN